MTPVSLVASAVSAKPPPPTAGDPAAGDGQEAFLDALLDLLADIAGLPEATGGEAADDSGTEGAVPPEAVAGSDAHSDRPEIDWAEVTLVPVPPATTPAADASAAPVAEPTAPVASAGVPDTGRGTTPTISASLAPDILPDSDPDPPTASPDIDAPATAAYTDNSAPRPEPPADSPEVDAPTTAADTDNGVHRPADGSRNDREPSAQAITSARTEPGAPTTGEAETIAAVRAEPSPPASHKRETTRPAPDITGRTADTPAAIASQDRNEAAAATPAPDDGARSGTGSPADFADRDTGGDPPVRSVRETQERATPFHTASRSDIATHDATVAAAAQAGAPPAGAAERGPTPTTIVAVPVTAEHLAEIVSREVVHATPRGEHRLEITLHPPELGRVEVNLVVGRDSVQAHLVAHTEGARDLLTHHLTDLREQLVAQGFADPRLSVDLRHGSGDRGGYRADRHSDLPPGKDGEAAPAPGPVRMPGPRERHALHLIA